MAIPHLSLDVSLDPGPSGSQFTWRPPALAVLPTGSVQGGAAFGAAIAAIEAVTARRARWASCQFFSVAPGGTPLDLEVSVLAAGRSSSQAACRATSAGVAVFSATGAVGSRSGEADGVWLAMPQVPVPERCEAHRYFTPGNGDLGDLAELRIANMPGAIAPGRAALWARGRQDSQSPLTAWDLAIIADLAPMVLRDVVGGPYIGSSIDNSIRIGSSVPSEWVLIDIAIDQVVDGFGHCRGALWSQEGVLLATVAQTTTLRRGDRDR